MDVREKLIEILSQYGDGFDGDFRDSGVNSIEFVKILVNLENEFNIEFDDEMLDIEKMPTLDALCEMLEKLIEEKDIG
ncbi:MAG: hypothetical protein J6L77_04040 [Coprococcus sp.]|nr:hypothetical protein [Coprococcus sp.]